MASCPLILVAGFARTSFQPTWFQVEVVLIGVSERWEELVGHGVGVDVVVAAPLGRLHALEDDGEHLRERRLGRGLVDRVPGDEVDVVAGPHRDQEAPLVDLAGLRRDGREQRPWRRLCAAPAARLC